MKDDHSASTPTLVAGRYELAEEIGRGGASVVHAAVDRVTGARVAVKILTEGPLNLWPRVRRELMALRLLRVPGVVTLLDDGAHEGAPFLVMDVADGKPFPGVPDPAPWEAIAPAALSLLETLARVHAAGVVHRDLKPSNVLCAESGRVTVLDFGLAWGPELGEALTAAGTVIGTPAYLAPEQFASAGGDARSDLYAVGVMLYGSLAGRLSHPASDLLTLISLRRSAAPTPIRHLVPDLPRDVARVVDQLLAIDPGDRPQTAGETIRALFGGARVDFGDVTLPRLGDATVVERVVAAASAGRSVDVYGPPGSGRSRVLSEATDRLTSAGRDVRWLVPSAAPYESLATLLGPLDDLASAGPEEARAELRSRLAAKLAAGTVVVADDTDRVDRWTAELVASCRGDGAVVRVVPERTEGCVELLELSEADLRPLFAGPDRIFHLCEDGAHELWRRSGGLEARVAAEAAAWCRHGLARWRDGKLVVTREAVDRLRAGHFLGDVRSLRPGPRGSRSAELDELLAWIALAWPNASTELLARAVGRPMWRLVPEIEQLERDGMVRRLADGRVQPLVLPQAMESWTQKKRRAAHLDIARALRPGTPLRLRHLAAAGEPREVLEEALLRAPDLAREGRTGDALVVAELGLLAARESASAGSEERVLVCLAKIALAAGAERRALYEIARAARRTPALVRVEELLTIARDVMSGDPDASLARIDGLGPFDDLELELWRHGQRVRLGLRLPPEREGRIVSEIVAWARARGDARATASGAVWSALHLRRIGRPDEAAAEFVAHASTTDRALARISDLINATLCLLDAGRLDEARRCAADARTAAAACRHILYEACAETFLAHVAYRSGEPGPVDAELVRSVGLLGEPYVEADLCVTQAARAWRNGDLGAARELARRAQAASARSGSRCVRILARAVELVAGAAPSSSSETADLADEAGRLEERGAGAQALGLLALLDAARAPAWRRRAAERVATLPRCDRSLRLEVLSLGESLEDGACRGPGAKG